MGTDLTAEQISSIIGDATKEQFDVCIIDLLNSTIRKNFLDYYNV